VSLTAAPLVASHPGRRDRPAATVLGLVLALTALAPHDAAAQVAFLSPLPLQGPAPVPLLSQDQDPTLARQVTLFGVLATPHNNQMDPKLQTVAAQLRKLLPNHGFRLLGVQSRRLTIGQTLTCPLDDGFIAEALLLHPFDLNGKVQLRCAVTLNQVPQLATQVGTPPNQLFFCEKLLPNRQRLLIGVGAR
jgi:hypothetical protein